MSVYRVAVIFVMAPEQPHWLLLVSSKDVFKRAFTIDLYNIEGFMEQKTQPTVLRLCNLKIEQQRNDV